MHVFHVISATSTHDVDMIRFLAPECPVNDFDAERILITASQFAEHHISSHETILFGKEILLFVSSATVSAVTANPAVVMPSKINPFMELLPHAGLLALVSLGIFECLANENKWITSTELIEAVTTLHGCLNIDDLLSISNLPESCEDLHDYFEYQIQELWKRGYLVSENSTRFTGWWDLEQDASSGTKLFALNTESTTGRHKRFLYTFGMIIQPFVENMMVFIARKLKNRDVVDFGRENEWLKSQEFDDEVTYLSETLELLIYYDLRK